MIDFKKSFTGQNHQNLITKLGDMGVPGWLLNIVVGFLQERELILSYNGPSLEERRCLEEDPRALY